MGTPNMPKKCRLKQKRSVYRTLFIVFITSAIVVALFLLTTIIASKL